MHRALVGVTDHHLFAASHQHTAKGLNQPYAYSYVFAYAMDLPKGTTSLTLPTNDKVRVLAVSVARTAPDVNPAQPLFDKLKHEDVQTAMK